MQSHAGGHARGRAGETESRAPRLPCHDRRFHLGVEVHLGPQSFRCPFPRGELNERIASARRTHHNIHSVHHGGAIGATADRGNVRWGVQDSADARVPSLGVTDDVGDDED